MKMILTILTLLMVGCGDGKSTGERMGEAVSKIRSHGKTEKPLIKQREITKENNNTKIEPKNSTLKDIALKAKEQIKDATEPVKESAKDIISLTKDSIKEVIAEKKESIKDGIIKAKEVASDAKKSLKDEAKKIKSFIEADKKIEAE